MAEKQEEVVDPKVGAHEEQEEAGVPVAPLAKDGEQGPEAMPTQPLAGQAQQAVAQEPDEAEDGEAAEEKERLRMKREGERQFRAVLISTLSLNSKDFGEAIAQSSLKELGLLMEVIAGEPLSRNRVRHAGQLKKQFDTRYAAELARLKEVSPEDKAGQAEKQEVSDLSFRFSEAMGTFNKAKGSFEETDRKSREESTVQKEALLAELRALVLKEDARMSKEVQAIQQKWKALGPVVPFKAEEINESYKALLDQFYSLRSNYMELVDQDRRVNLEQKQALIQTLQQLGKPTDEQALDPTYWSTRTDRVNALHAEWKALGPVPRKESEPVWEAFKAANNQFYEARRRFYTTRDELREHNQDLKAQMLEQVQLYAHFSSEDATAWQQATEELKALQEQWFAHGPAPKEVNAELNRRFKKEVNAFFDAKSTFYKSIDDKRAELVKRKEELATQADALKDSEDWEPTIETLKKLQHDWKQTGPDTYKEARKPQKRFRHACDTFFTRLKNRHKAALEQEEQNLERKTAELAKLEALLTQQPENMDEATKAVLRLAAEDIQKAYAAIGDVPRRAAGKMAAKWQAAWNQYLSLVVEDASQLAKIQQESKFLSIRNDQGEEALDREYKRMSRLLRELEEEIQQYQNNILFIAKGKKGDPLRADIQQKIEQAEKKRAKLDKEFKVLKRMARS
ncbi:MAG: DUF349 domain-containing protein [Bacteroidetes bacterium]|jgi:glycerol-3-phosphate cytidylyltransferase-like family protein|nr:DUF349 domain-containing protein [Bacteroidota bacterium]